MWAIATLEGYTSRSELIRARIDLTAASGSDVTPVETKLADIEQESRVRSSLEVIGMALLAPSSDAS